MSRQQVSKFAKDEWLLVLSALGLLITSIIAWRMPSYSRSDFEILYILLVLFIVTTGLRRYDVLGTLARRVERGRLISVKLVLVTFFFSMLVTNDVALMALVPLTLLLNVPHREWLVIDASNQVLGRVASDIARLLRGKHKAMYTPHLDTGDFVVVVNAERVRLTGRYYPRTT